MDSLFVVYDPAFMALVWPKIKNGVHLSLDRYCWGEISVFFKDFLDGRAWAYKSKILRMNLERKMRRGESFTVEII
ncbi:unnamed protein product [Leptidea sinapis]|uniref:Uncharacterized protein n=1 Tax=Leptidea sinapis TaxID=189913 RepID=A0A5E4PPJ3_9NEOP|nr:unnamed protein product [Leptidea sinapis]